jgi:phosphoglycolate phosphatase-like HAD superfamily hydrolase
MVFGGSEKGVAGRARPLLVLDFDGVICDSLDECFISSWIGYFSLAKGIHPPHVPVTLRNDFARLRPFIRTAEDYMLIQEILHEGKTVSDQSGFDELIAAAGPEKMRLFRELFTKARTDLLARDREFWLSLNPVYPHILTMFARLPQEAPVHILSTKKAQFIAEILMHAQIRLPAGHIHESAAREKLARVEALRVEGGFPRAVFVDDQIDHLKENTNPNVEVFLASWGYVKPEWLTGGKIPVMAPADLMAFIEREYLE